MGAVTNLNDNDKGIVIDEITTDSLPAQRHTSRRKPLLGGYVALLLFIFIYCARPEDYIPGLSHVPLEKIIGYFAMLALVLSLRHIRDRLRREVFFLFVLIVQLFVASLMSPVWRGGSFQETLNFAKVLIIILLITAAVTTLHRLRLLICTQAISVSAVAAVALWKRQLLLGRLEGILGGNYFDPNDMALAIVMSLPLCLALLLLSRNWLWKITWSISMLVMIYAVLLTGSRGGFLALVMAAVVSLWEFAIQGRRRYLLAIAALASVAVLPFSTGMLVGRLKGTFDVKGDRSAAYDSAQQRQQLFWRSIEVTKEHPFFGVGPDNFGQISGSWHVTHNSFTQMSSEGGVPALVLYVLILWCGFKNLKAVKRLARGQTESSLLARALLASLAGYVVGSTFLSVAYQFFPYILVAYTTTLFSIARKSASQTRKYESAQQVAVEKQSTLETVRSEMSWHAI